MKVNLYITTYNSPGQFQTLIDSLVNYDKDFLELTNKYVINNSTDSSFDEYQQICDKWNFTHLKYDNLGIMGARLEAAKHFDQSDSDYYFYFEDDMLLEKSGQCRMGFLRWTSNLFQKSIEIIKKEGFDFLKLNFTEVQIANDSDWIRSLELSNSYGKGQRILYKSHFNWISSYKGLSYITGEVYLSNWPLIMSKTGNKKCYLQKDMTGLLEHQLSKLVHISIIKREITSAVLLLSPILHKRIERYSERKEF